MATFADMLVYFRKQACLSQKELSEKTGLSRSAIGMYESGRREPDFETLETIADFFNINMDTLLGRVSSPESPSPSDTPTPPPSLPLQRLTQALDELNDEGQTKLVDYADDLVSSGRYRPE